MLLAAAFCVSNLYAVLIGPFPGLEKLSSKSDAIVILRVDHQLTDVDSNLYATYDCIVYQTLKGEIPTGKTIRLQLMDTRTSFVSPYAIHSSHLMFLTRKRNDNEPTEYRTIETEGANVLLTPFGHEQMPEGKTIEDRIRSLLKRTIEYNEIEHRKERDFLDLMVKGVAAPVRKN
jgi:hypothetical protein